MIKEARSEKNEIESLLETLIKVSELNEVIFARKKNLLIGCRDKGARVDRTRLSLIAFDKFSSRNLKAFFKFLLKSTSIPSWQSHAMRLFSTNSRFSSHDSILSTYILANVGYRSFKQVTHFLVSGKADVVLSK